jgi:hypothetical protein
LFAPLIVLQTEYGLLPTIDTPSTLNIEKSSQDVKLTIHERSYTIPLGNGSRQCDLGNFPGQHWEEGLSLEDLLHTLELTSFDETSPSPNNEPALAKVPKIQAKW